MSVDSLLNGLCACGCRHLDALLQAYGIEQGTKHIFCCGGEHTSLIGPDDLCPEAGCSQDPKSRRVFVVFDPLVFVSMICYIQHFFFCGTNGINVFWWFYYVLPSDRCRLTILPCDACMLTLWSAWSS